MVKIAAITAGFFAFGLIIVFFSEGLLRRLWIEPLYLYKTSGSVVFTFVVAGYGIAMLVTMYKLGENLRRKNMAQIAGFVMVAIAVGHEFRIRMQGGIPNDHFRFLSTVGVGIVIPLIWYGWAKRQYRQRMQ
ncbi:MAG: hypothetical protein NUW37_04110 [Planctomycetes bacterium]|nr:hypothetical protein [Planctomycetota bacterium]